MNISFIGVENCDKNLITSKYPDAIICEKILQGKELIEKSKNSEILSILTMSKLQKDILEKLPKLKLIVTRSVGFDHIDLNYCKEKKIKVCTVPDYGSHIISEHVFALLLGSIRHIVKSDEIVKSGKFSFDPSLRGIGLKGKTIGVIGTGKIGLGVCEIAKGFGMNVLGFDKFQNNNAAKEIGFEYSELNNLLNKSDFISLHVPLFPETHHLINKETISQMKDGVVIINTARGEIINTEDLIEGLESGKIAFAGLDVIEDETHANHSQKLIENKNVLITPHTAFYSQDSIESQYRQTFENIDLFKKGKELNNEITA